MALYNDLIVDQGSNYNGKIPVFSKNGLPIDITGFSSRGQIRKNHMSLTAIDFTTQIDNPELGEVFISLTPEQTSLMKPGRYVFDVEIYNDDESNVIRIAEGQVEVTPRVTNAYDLTNSP